MATNNDSDLPRAFCWTRFGTEAGEPIERIFARKEAERRANGGVFYWGIGNSVSQGIALLIRVDKRPEVLFSPIKSRFRTSDVQPDSVVRWTVAETLDGERYALPEHVVITSRSSIDKPKTAHYALVCASQEPLQTADCGSVDLRALRNLTSGRGLGASQVTAVVTRADGDPAVASAYKVAVRVSLAAPYFVRLHDPIATYGG